jgi:hypothetical protein
MLNINGVQGLYHLFFSVGAVPELRGRPHKHWVPAFAFTVDFTGGGDGGGDFAGPSGAEGDKVRD